MIRLTKQRARQLAVMAQLLDDRPAGDASHVVRRLGLDEIVIDREF